MGILMFLHVTVWFRGQIVVIRILELAHLGFRHTLEQQAWLVSHDH